MEVQLQDIVDKIKKDGVVLAEEKANKIVADAEERAKKIVQEAQAKAEQIVKTGKEEASRFERASISAIEQASRNTLLSFRDGLLKELNALIATETKKAYDVAMLKDLIPKTVKAWTEHSGESDLSVILSVEDAKNLESSLISALKSELGKGVEILPNRDVTAGFRIGMKDGVAYYDFSAESVSNLFSNYLNPRVSEILKSVTKE